jgi:hypothetical protein
MHPLQLKIMQHSASVGYPCQQFKGDAPQVGASTDNNAAFSEQLLMTQKHWPK